MATRDEIAKQNLEFVHGKRTHGFLDDPGKVSDRSTKAKYVDPDATPYGGASYEESQHNTVFVSNISFNATVNQISAFFKDCGAVVRVNVPTARASGGHKGFAFVTFADVQGVTKALARNNDELCGRNVRVRKSDAKNPTVTGKPAQGEQREQRDHRNASDRSAFRTNDDRLEIRKYGVQGEDKADQRVLTSGRIRDRSRDRSRERISYSRQSPARAERNRDRFVRDDQYRRRGESRDRMGSRHTERDRSADSRDRRSPNRSPIPPRKSSREQDRLSDSRRGRSHFASPPRRVREKSADTQRHSHKAASRIPSPARRQRAASPSPPCRAVVDR